MIAGLQTSMLLRRGTGTRTGGAQASGTGNPRRNQGGEQAEQVFSLKREDSRAHMREKEIGPIFACSPVLPVPAWGLDKYCLFSGKRE
jgi:hypothetical protein